MSVDLRSRGWFRQTSVLLESDCLILLEHERTKDRMRRVMYDRVEQVIVWRRVAVWSLVLWGLILGGCSIPLLVIAKFETVIFAAVFLAVLALIWAYYFYCGLTTIRIVRMGKNEDITGIYWPGTVREIIVKLQDKILAVQRAGHANEFAEQAQSAAQATPPPAQTPAEPPTES